jgi:hypothetical protein
MTAVFLILAAAYGFAVVMSHLVNPTVTFHAEFNPTLSYGTRAKITASFTVKGAGPAHMFSVLVPLASIADNADAVIWSDLYTLASSAVSSWALRPKRDRDQLLRELTKLSSPSFAVVRCVITDIAIPPEPVQPPKPEPPPRPKSFAERVIDAGDAKLLGAALLVNRVRSAPKRFPGLFADPIGKEIVPKIFNDMKGQILLGEPPQETYHQHAIGARKHFRADMP